MGGRTACGDPRFAVSKPASPTIPSLSAPATARCSSSPTWLSKMNHNTPLGSRIAEVHNGSSLFTGDAGQGESNIRRWIIENDWLEASPCPSTCSTTPASPPTLGALERKPEHAKARCSYRCHPVVQAAPQNLGKKNCELSDRRHQAHLEHSSPSRKPSSRRSSPMPPSVTARSPSSAVRLHSQITPRQSKRCVLPPARR